MSWACKSCCTARSEAWRRDNIDKARGQARLRATKWYHRNVPSALLAAAKYRAKKKGLPFEITAADIVIPETCPALGFPMAAGGEKFNSPSVDRIDPALGYVPGNIVVVSFLANSIKFTADPEQIIKVGEFYRDLVQHRSAHERETA
ncbi:hypothetical protein [Roseomonas sp. WA12]